MLRIKEAMLDVPGLFCLLPQVIQMIFSIVWHIKTGTKARDPSFVSRFISEPFGLGDGRLIEG